MASPTPRPADTGKEHDVLIDWAQGPDIFSDRCLYEEGGHFTEAQRKRRQSHPTGGPSPPARHKFNEPVELDKLRENGPPLGPVLVASYDIKRAAASLKKNGLLFMAMLFSVLVVEAEFSRQCELSPLPPPARNPRVDRMAPSNIEDLRGWNFLVPLAPPDLKGRELEVFMGRYHAMRFARLFSTPKSNGIHRTLLNGIPGNEALAPPPYFTFFSPEAIVRRLRSLVTFTGFTVDIRHHFYRIPMHRRMARYYTVAPGGDFLVPTVLPMGSTWGPALGQISTIAMIAHRRDPKVDEDLGLRVPKDCIPSILELVDATGTVIGYIMICIDNIAVVCSDPGITDKWYRRLTDNAKQFGIHPFKKEARTHWSNDIFEFIGLHYGNGRWRHCDDRIDRWKSTYGLEGSATFLRKLTSGVLQSLVGVLVWDRRLRCQGMRTMRETFGIMNRALCETNPLPPTEAELDHLNTAWSEFTRNSDQEWSDDVWPPPHCGRPTRFIITDASMPLWSWVEMRDGKVLRNPSGSFPSTVANPIYYKEMYAILVALKQLDADGIRSADIFLVGDSKACIGSLSKRLAPEHAWAMIDENIELFGKNDWGLVLRWVESDGNVAHSATHEEKLEEYRIQRSWLVANSVVFPPPVGQLKRSSKRQRD